MKKCYLALLVALNFQLSGVSLASEKHVHGFAVLTIAAQGSHVEIELASPAANLVGFEHKVSTPKQQEIVEGVNEKLRAVERLFQFQGGGCKADKVDIDLSAVSESSDHDESHHHESHHDSDHGSHHAHHKERSEARHSDISATYYYTCEKLKGLKTITVALLDEFQGIHKLKAMWITESQQSADTLTKTSNVIHFDS